MEQLATQIKGISEPTRLRILNLVKEGELCVCDLIEVLNLPQSTISRHLAYLRKSGWVEARKAGKWMHYRRPVAPPPFVAYALAMLDDEFSNQPQAVIDSKALAMRLLAKGNGSCTETCA